jgi:hypothetical protein
LYGWDEKRAHGCQSSLPEKRIGRHVPVLPISACLLCIRRGELASSDCLFWLRRDDITKFWLSCMARERGKYLVLPVLYEQRTERTPQ